MAIAGRVFQAIGAALVIFAGSVALGPLLQNGGWIQLSPWVYVIFSAIVALPGIGLLLLGTHLVREVRDERRFNEEMNAVNERRPEK